jgi:hypothetical protein
MVKRSDETLHFFSKIMVVSQDGELQTKIKPILYKAKSLKQKAESA